MQENTTNRLRYADLLRVAATIAVITLHVAATLTYLYYSEDHHWWWMSNAVDSAMRWCVPIFIMISGLLLLNPNKKEPILVFLKKRVVRVFIPLLAWSFFYTVWNAKDNLQAYSLVTAAANIFQGPQYYHLGFLYTLMGLYLVTPILRVYVAGASQENMTFLLILWFVFSSIFPFTERFLSIKTGVQPDMVVGFIGYFILGYYLGCYEISPGTRKIIYALGFISWLFTVVATYFLTIANKGVIDETFYAYLRPNVVMMSGAVFLFFKYFNWQALLDQQPVINKTIDIIGILSFGIYLVHPVILELISKIHINAWLIHPLIGIPLSVVVAFIVSFSVAFIFKKMPFLKASI